MASMTRQLKAALKENAKLRAVLGDIQAMMLNARREAGCEFGLLTIDSEEYYTILSRAGINPEELRQDAIDMHGLRASLACGRALRPFIRGWRKWQNASRSIRRSCGLSAHSQISTTNTSVSKSVLL
jgi:hypothetical protein